MSKQWCYMIVSPDPRDSSGATNFGAKVLQKWFVKFGDGDPTMGEDEVQGRYSTHNPSFFLTTNKTARIGTTFEKSIFKDRDFKSAGQSREWYVVYENNVPSLRATLLNRVTEFGSLDLTKTTVVDQFISDVETDIPTKCNSPQ